MSAKSLTEAERIHVARTLLQCVIDHRSICPGADCTISLSILLPLYRDLIERDPEDYELKCFL